MVCPTSILQFLVLGFGLIGVREPAIGVVEGAVANREHYKRIPRTGVLQVGLREVGIAIGVGVVDADQIELAATSFLVGAEQILRAELVTGRLLPFVRIFQRKGYLHG